MEGVSNPEFHVPVTRFWPIHGKNDDDDDDLLNLFSGHYSLTTAFFAFITQ